jgi:ABC-type transporter Mla MlaB component
LLVEARDLARQTGCDLRLVDLPAELVDLARMSQCEALISGG